MINGHCTTNWDKAKHWTWPKSFVSVPRIGERVRAKENGEYTVMQVVLVTHFIGKISEESMIEVELGRIH